MLLCAALNWAAQKDCMAWSKARLAELFANMPLVTGSAEAHTTGLESVTGEAFPVTDRSLESDQ